MNSDLYSELDVSTGCFCHVLSRNAAGCQVCWLNIIAGAANIFRKIFLDVVVSLSAALDSGQVIQLDQVNSDIFGTCGQNLYFFVSS